MRAIGTGLVVVATLLAVTCTAACGAPLQATLAAAAVAVAWILLVLARPTSRWHVLPMSMCVGLGALLAAGDARLAGIAVVTLAIFAWDATVLLEATTRFGPRKSRRHATTLLYAVTAAGIGTTGFLAYAMAEIRPIRVTLTFPLAFTLSVIVLLLLIGLLWIGKGAEPQQIGAPPLQPRAERTGRTTLEDRSPTSRRSD